MKDKIVLTLVISMLCTGLSFAQSPVKEAMNSFALYTRKKEFSELEKARKTIDNGFVTKKDSLSYKNNLVRGLIYSTLAFVDSNRTLTYVKDPIQEGLYSYGNLNSRKLNYEHEPEISFIKKQLAKAYLVVANRALADFSYEKAYDAYAWVDSLGGGSIPMATQNLAILSQRLGYTTRAISFYEQLIRNKDIATPDYFLTLAALYENTGNLRKAQETIHRGRLSFPKNEDLLFREINFYSDLGAYDVVTNLSREGLQLQPDNVTLNYLAGFSFDVMGKQEVAREYYKKVISIDPNNYDGNYSLGLLNLRRYLDKGEKNEEVLQDAKTYLNKALEIDPNAVNVLKSLAVLYRKTGDMINLEKVNDKLNQVILK